MKYSRIVRRAFQPSLGGLLSFVLIFQSFLPSVAQAQEGTVVDSSPTVVANSTELLDYYPPSDLARVSDSYFVAGSTIPLVLLIQDLHCHPGVQRKISGLLSHYDSLGIAQDSVFVEGASGLVDTTPMALFPDEAIKREVTEEFVDSGLFTGMEEYAILNKKTHYLYGVEEGKTYNLHKDFFRKSLEGRSQLAQKIQSLQGELQTLEPSILNRNQKKLLEKSRDYQSGRLSLAKYLKYLDKQSSDIPAELKSMQSLLDLETQLPKPERLKSDTKDFLTILYPRFTKEEADRLSQYAKANTEVYYLYLFQLANRYNALSGASTALRDYLTYNHRKEHQDLSQFQRKLEGLEHQLLLAESKDQTSKNLIQAQRDLKLLSELLELKLTEDQLKEILPRTKDLLAVLGTLIGSQEKTEELQELIAQAIDFYALALMRDDPLITKTLEKQSNNPAILVTGGFHTQGIARMLKAKNIPYLTLSPNVESYGEEDQKRYISVLTGKIPDEYTAFAVPQQALGPTPGEFESLALRVAQNRIEHPVIKPKTATLPKPVPQISTVAQIPSHGFFQRHSRKLIAVGISSAVVALLFTSAVQILSGTSVTSLSVDGPQALLSMSVGPAGQELPETAAAPKNFWKPTIISVAVAFAFVGASYSFMTFVHDPIQAKFPPLLLFSATLVSILGGVSGAFLAQVWKNNGSLHAKDFDWGRIFRRIWPSVFTGAVAGFLLYGWILPDVLGDKLGFSTFSQALFMQLVVALFWLDGLTYVLNKVWVEKESVAEALHHARQNLWNFSKTALWIFLPVHTLALTLGGGNPLLSFILLRIGGLIWQALLSDLILPKETAVVAGAKPLSLPGRFMQGYHKSAGFRVFMKSSFLAACGVVAARWLYLLKPLLFSLVLTLASPLALPDVSWAMALPQGSNVGVKLEEFLKGNPIEFVKEIKIAPDFDGSEIVKLTFEVSQEFRKFLENTPLSRADSWLRISAKYQQQLIIEDQAGGFIRFVAVISNALDSMLDKAELSQEVHQGKIVLRLRRSGEHLIIELEDNGIGFTLEALQKWISNPDFTSKPVPPTSDFSPRKRAGGKGVGKSYYGHELLRAHEGFLEIDSRNKQSGSHLIRSDYSSGATQWTAPVPSARAEEGTLIRWTIKIPSDTKTGEKGRSARRSPILRTAFHAALALTGIVATAALALAGLDAVGHPAELLSMASLSSVMQSDPRIEWVGNFEGSQRRRHFSFLNRYPGQWMWIQERILPDLIRRALEKPEKTLKVLVLGASTGEELVRTFHELVKGLESQGQNPEDWNIQIHGIERDETMLQEARQRLSDKKFQAARIQAYSSGQREVVKEYPFEVLKTLDRYPDLFRKALRLHEGDIQDAALLDPFSDSQLVLANSTLGYLNPLAREKLLARLDDWTDAWVVSTMFQKYPPAMNRHTVTSHPSPIGRIGYVEHRAYWTFEPFWAREDTPHVSSLVLSTIQRGLPLAGMAIAFFLAAGSLLWVSPETVAQPIGLTAMALPSVRRWFDRDPLRAKFNVFLAVIAVVGGVFLARERFWKPENRAQKLLEEFIGTYDDLQKINRLNASPMIPAVVNEALSSQAQQYGKKLERKRDELAKTIVELQDSMVRNGDIVSVITAINHGFIPPETQTVVMLKNGSGYAMDLDRFTAFSRTNNPAPPDFRTITLTPMRFYKRSPDAGSVRGFSADWFFVVGPDGIWEMMTSDKGNVYRPREWIRSLPLVDPQLIESWKTRKPSQNAPAPTNALPQKPTNPEQPRPRAGLPKSWSVALSGIVVGVAVACAITMSFVSPDISNAPTELLSAAFVPSTLYEFKEHAEMIRRKPEALVGEVDKSRRRILTLWEKMDRSLTEVEKQTRVGFQPSYRTIGETVRSLSHEPLRDREECRRYADDLLAAFRRLDNALFLLRFKTSKTISDDFQREYAGFQNTLKEARMLVFHLNALFHPLPGDTLAGLVQEMDLSQSFDTIRDTLRKEFDQRGVPQDLYSINIHVPQTTQRPLVQSARVFLTFALYELCRNAVQSTIRWDHGDLVSVREDSQVTVTIEESSSGYIVRIQDNGIGMTPKLMDRLDEWGASFPKRNLGMTFGGLGIGVKMARQIIEEHGGTVSYESDPAVGTTVTITLPAKIPKPKVMRKYSRTKRALGLFAAASLGFAIWGMGDTSGLLAAAPVEASDIFNIRGSVTELLKKKKLPGDRIPELIGPLQQVFSEKLSRGEQKRRVLKILEIPLGGDELSTLCNELESVFQTLQYAPVPMLKAAPQNPLPGRADKALVDWARNLTLLINQHGASDFNGLRAAGDSLPQEGLKAGWQQTVARLESWVADQKTKNVSDDIINFFFIREINQEWFIQNGLLLFLNEHEHEVNTVFGKNNSAVLTTIQGSDYYQIADHVMPVYFIDIPDAGDDRTLTKLTMSYQRVEGFILVQPKELDNRSKLFWEQEPERSQTEMLTIDMNPAFYHLRRKLRGVFFKRYRTYENFHAALVESVLREELRHAYDYLQLESKTNNRSPYFNEESFKDLRHFIAPGSIFTKEHERLLKEGHTSQKAEFMGFLSEMSARLARCAFGGDPLLMLFDWVGTLSNNSPEDNEFRYHFSAAYGVTWLAERLKRPETIPDAVFKRERLTESESERLVRVIEAIAETSPDRLRLELKAIYKSEFAFDFDDTPFPKIGNDGKLIPRTSATTSSGYLEVFLAALSLGIALWGAGDASSLLAAAPWAGRMGRRRFAGNLSLWAIAVSAAGLTWREITTKKREEQGKVAARGSLIETLGVLWKDPEHPDIRSAEATLEMTEKLKPAFRGKGKITVLYPGAGSHMTPLVIAHELIRSGTIREAEFLLTEIDPDSRKRFCQTIRALCDAGFYTDYQESKQTLDRDETETVMTVRYQGWPITLRYTLLNKDRKDFWRPEQAQAADLVYLHDIPLNAHDFLGKLLFDRRSGEDKPGELWVMSEDNQNQGDETYKGVPRGILNWGFFGDLTVAKGGFGHRQWVKNGERGVYDFNAANLIRFDKDLIPLSRLSVIEAYAIGDLMAILASNRLMEGRVSSDNSININFLDRIERFQVLERTVEKIIQKETDLSRRVRWVAAYLKVQWICYQQSQGKKAKHLSFADWLKEKDKKHKSPGWLKTQVQTLNDLPEQTRKIDSSEDWNAAVNTYLNSIKPIRLNWLEDDDIHRVKIATLAVMVLAVVTVGWLRAMGTDLSSNLLSITPGFVFTPYSKNVTVREKLIRVSGRNKESVERVESSLRALAAMIPKEHLQYLDSVRINPWLGFGIQGWGGSAFWKTGNIALKSKSEPRILTHELAHNLYWNDLVIRQIWKERVGPHPTVHQVLHLVILLAVTMCAAIPILQGLPWWWHLAPWAALFTYMMTYEHLVPLPLRQDFVDPKAAWSRFEDFAISYEHFVHDRRNFYVHALVEPKLRPRYEAMEAIHGFPHQGWDRIVKGELPDSHVRSYDIGGREFSYNTRIVRFVLYISAMYLFVRLVCWVLGVDAPFFALEGGGMGAMVPISGAFGGRRTSGYGQRKSPEISRAALADVSRVLNGPADHLSLIRLGHWIGPSGSPVHMEALDDYIMMGSPRDPDEHSGAALKVRWSQMPGSHAWVGRYFPILSELVKRPEVSARLMQTCSVLRLAFHDQPLPEAVPLLRRANMSLQATLKTPFRRYELTDLERAHALMVNPTVRSRQALKKLREWQKEQLWVSVDWFDSEGRTHRSHGRIIELRSTDAKPFITLSSVQEPIALDHIGTVQPRLLVQMKIPGQDPSRWALSDAHFELAKVLWENSAHDPCVVQPLGFFSLTGETSLYGQEFHFHEKPLGAAFFIVPDGIRLGDSGLPGPFPDEEVDAMAKELDLDPKTMRKNMAEDVFLAILRVHGLGWRLGPEAHPGNLLLSEDGFVYLVGDFDLASPEPLSMEERHQELLKLAGKELAPFRRDGNVTRKVIERLLVGTEGRRRRAALALSVLAELGQTETFPDLVGSLQALQKGEYGHEPTTRLERLIFKSVLGEEEEPVLIRSKIHSLTSRHPILEGLPSVFEVRRLLDQEGYLFFENARVGEGAFAFLIEEEKEESVAIAKDYLNRILPQRRSGKEAPALSHKEVLQWVGCASEGISFHVSALKWTIDALNKALGSRIPEWVKGLGIPENMGNVQGVVVVSHETSSPQQVALEEAFHALEGVDEDDADPNITKSPAREPLNDLFVLLFFPNAELAHFNSPFSDWTLVVKMALKEHYTLNGKRNPNIHMPAIIQAVMDDVQKNALITVTSRGRVKRRIPAVELLFGQAVREQPGYYIEGALEAQEDFRIKALDYLTSLKEKQHFGRYPKGIFPSWKPDSPSAKKRWNLSWRWGTPMLALVALLHKFMTLFAMIGALARAEEQPSPDTEARRQAVAGLYQKEAGPELGPLMPNAPSDLFQKEEHSADLLELRRLALQFS